MTRTPIYFDGCFGWLHSPVLQTGTKVGVVLCPAFGQEEICLHYGMMVLADEIAAKGMPTVRFDYRGTGNSVAGDVTFAGLIADVERAVAYLRQECGVGTVVLAGVRLGAAVALRAASLIPGVGAMVLMAPVLAGSAFLRETRAAAAVSSLSALDPVPALESGLALNANGFHWPGAFQQELAATDLTQTPAPAMQVLLLPAREDRRSGKLAAAWRSTGTEVTERPFTEYPEWMRDPTTSVTPINTFRSIADWLSGAGLVAGESVPQAHVTVTHELTGDAFVETPMCFGEGNNVFGILCRPRNAKGAPVAALLLHEGSSHNIGDGGAYVVLARMLAENGIASLRMDLTGMGDSDAKDNTRHPHYDPERIPEGIAGLDVLQHAGYSRSVVFGLCAGAYTALQVTLADRRVIGNVLVNLQKFIWHYGDDIRIAARDNKRTLKAYVRAMRNPGEWKRAFSGRADVKGVLRVLAKRGIGRITHGVRGLMPPPPDSERAKVYAQMRELSERRVLTNLIFADDDPGLAEIRIQFGNGGRRLAQFAPARFILLDKADHHFNGSSARQRYYQLALEIMQSCIASRIRRTSSSGIRAAASVG